MQLKNNILHEDSLSKLGETPSCPRHMPVVVQSTRALQTQADAILSCWLLKKKESTAGCT